MGLSRYLRKRDFRKTPEPRGGKGSNRRRGGIFVVQKHDATRLHYDFRLEWDGVLKSWAVPKGPSLDPGEKRLAVHVEDHPVAYADFEGVIPHGEYGGGPVIVWDRGTWTPRGDPRAGYAAGKLAFTLTGEKLRGGWALIRMRGRGDKNWLLVKERDAEARTGSAAAVADLRPESVKTGRSIERLGKGRREASSRSAAAPSRRAMPEARPRPRATKPSSAPSRRSRAPSADPAELAGATKSPLPHALAAELATLVDAAPEGDDWLHEIKFDGYRILARVEDGKATLVSRNAKDWTSRFPKIAEALSALSVASAVLDGELVSMRADGTTSFEGLQGSLRGQNQEALRYYAFDLLYLDGWDLRMAPLLARKTALKAVLRGAPRPIRFSEHVRGRGVAFHRSACSMGLEGIVSKLADSPYLGRRTRDWQKIRCGERQEFVIGGYAGHSADSTQIGALLLGVFDDAGHLRYAGRVGTGFSSEVRRDLKRRLDRLRRGRSPFHDPVDERGDVHWAEPSLVGEVKFTEWTADNRLRHPSLVGLREDKPARGVVRERPPAAPGRSVRAPTRSVPGPRRKAEGTDGEASVAGVTISHPDRLLWPDERITKRDLAAYYEAVADRMLRSAGGRPLMFLRCPGGPGGACFFQKHIEGALPEGVRAVEVAEKTGKGRYAAVERAAGIVALVQMGIVEFHGWGSRADRLERPDRIVFDLDPAPDVRFPRVVAAAVEVRDRLGAMGLRSFVKTTGGKGLHVEVPIARVHEWDEAKTFSHGLAQAIATAAPDRFVATASKARRAGKIFIDWLRNGRGATSVVAYSARARPGAPVATPLSWDELAERRFDPNRFSVLTVPARVASRVGDPWKDYESRAQRLPRTASAPPVPSPRRRSP